MSMNKNTVSSCTQLAFIADRVVNSLDSKKGYSDTDRWVFKQAKKLLDDVLTGREVMNTGKLQARAVELLGAYGIALNAYAALAASKKATQKEDIQKVMSAFREDLDELSSGADNEGRNLNVIRDFFSFVRDISLKSDENTFDRVNIGTNFSYGIT